MGNKEPLVGTSSGEWPRGCHLTLGLRHHLQVTETNTEVLLSAHNARCALPGNTVLESSLWVSGHNGRQGPLSPRTPGVHAEPVINRCAPAGVVRGLVGTQDGGLP